MRVLLSILLALSACLSAHAQYCNDSRFGEVEVFSINDVTKTTDVKYGSAVDWQGNSQDLTFNIHYPKLEVDTAALRPLIIFVHGGSFLSGEKEDFDNFCMYFAQRGFVAATIDYRLGHNCSVGDSLSYNKAVYRAAQDAHAAIRFMVKHADSLRVDTSWVFLGGGSAGSGTILSTVYVQQQEFNVDFPTIEDTLGAIKTSGNNLTTAFTIKGLMNNWGGIYAQYFDANEMLPMISFHGDADATVPIDSALDNSCLVNGHTVYGSRQLHNLLVANGVCSDLTVEPGGGHGIYNATVPQRKFRVSKAACFFKGIMCNTCNSVSTTDSVAVVCALADSITAVTILDDITALTIAPNPANHLLHLSGLDENEVIEVSIFNLQGQLMLTSLSNSVYIQHLSAGLYILKVKQGSQSVVRRFIKE